MVCEDCSPPTTQSSVWHALPDHILLRIGSFLKVDHLKAFNQTSKNLNCIVNNILWHTPNLQRRIDSEELNKLIHMPIRFLETKMMDNNSDRSGCKFAGVFKKIASLRGVVVSSATTDCSNDNDLNDVNLEQLQEYAHFITTLHIGGIASFPGCTLDMGFTLYMVTNALCASQFPKLKSLIIDELSFSFTHLKTLNKRFPITQICLSNLYVKIEKRISNAKSMALQIPAYLQELKSLECLVINKLSFTYEVIIEISKLTNLRRVILDSVGLLDGAPCELLIVALGKLVNLKYISVNAHLSSQAINQLQHLPPTCRVDLYLPRITERHHGQRRKDIQDNVCSLAQLKNVTRTLIHHIENEQFHSDFNSERIPLKHLQQLSCLPNVQVNKDFLIIDDANEVYSLLASMDVTKLYVSRSTTTLAEMDDINKHINKDVIHFIS